MFGRKKDPAPQDDVDTLEETATDTSFDAADTTEPTDGWEDLQASQDWREDGPFDISEVDLEDDEVERLDLGTMILTPSEGMEIQLQVMPGTTEAPAALLLQDQSGMEIALFAAPASGGFVDEVRRDIVATTREQGGVAEVHEGPFGPEVRRVLQIVDEEGQELVHQARIWLVEGPRWMLRASVMGEACFDETLDGAAYPFLEFMKNVVVRRGDRPRPAGDVLPMQLPDGVVAQEA